MRILLFADVHSIKKYLDEVIKKSKNAEIIVCLGDLTNFQNKMRSFLDELNKIGKTVLMLPGNHEIEQDLEKECSRFENIKYLHMDYYVLDDYVFFAYGSGGFMVDDHKFDRLAKKWDKLIVENKKIILLTHGPPYGTKIDIINKMHVGNKSVRTFIERHQPIICASGHLHENNGKRDKIGKTIVINPGPEGKVVDV